MRLSQLTAFFGKHWTVRALVLTTALITMAEVDIPQPGACMLPLDFVVSCHQIASLSLCKGAMRGDASSFSALRVLIITITSQKLSTTHCRITEYLGFSAKRVRSYNQR